jgi:predicted  nucleic acid-binding Zn-ribbon protein
MIPEIEALLVLQHKDQTIRRLERDLKRIPRDEADAKARLESDVAALASAKGKIQQNEISIKNLELDIETRRTTISRLKTQQFETKKNEEYQALGHEVERYQKEVSKLEDEELGFMEIGEKLQTTLDAAKEKLNVCEELVDEELAALGERRANGEHQIEEFFRERAAAAEKIDGDLVDRFDRIMGAKGDAAVVPLQHGTNCGGCHMKVTASTAKEVKGDNTLASCEQCGRILYLGDDDD